jgi:hypothetical protein
VTPDNLFVNETDEDGGDADGGIMRGVNSYLRPIAGVKAVGDSVNVRVWKD